MPYTYKPQKKELLSDIISFYKDNNIIENIYPVEYNYHILLYDILRFIPIKKLLLRNYSIINLYIPDSNLSDYAYKFFLEKKIKNRIKFLWGLLTVVERTRFINTYIE
jgi:hypothetical protein